MSECQAIDITELATLGEQFPLRLMQLGFRLMQVIDDQGRDQLRYVISPICEVPAGPFLMGTNLQHDLYAKSFKDELPQHEVFLPTFHIGTYPLTVAEYACAVHAGAVEEPHDGGGRMLGGLNDVSWQEQQQHADYPVVNVAWHDVMAYAQWRAQVTGEDWRLPTEAEWEKAARGTDGRIFPWGDDWYESLFDHDPNYVYMKTTTPVGFYADYIDASPYGAQDMMGNVYEWTSTTYQSYPYQAGDGREDGNAQTDMAVRGMWWASGPEPHFMRVAHRTHSHPSTFDRHHGTRLARGNGTDQLRAAPQ